MKEVLHHKGRILTISFLTLTMENNMKYIELKQQIKELAKDIKEKKGHRKESEYGYVAGLDRLRYEARHHHIAYCLLRGRSMSEIEKSCRRDNSPNGAYVNQIMMSIEPREEAIINEEAICCG